MKSEQAVLPNPVWKMIIIIIIIIIIVVVIVVIIIFEYRPWLD
jgi:hypothetical protein